jgi:uncharacterized protein YlxW (UPF0749 family)
MTQSRRNSLTIAALAVVLGLLIALQIQSQGGAGGLQSLSSQELTVLVANLNARNDQLRTEIATLEQEARGLAAGEARGETSLGQLQLDAARVRAWSGLSSVVGPGLRISITGPITGLDVENLLNELRNAGAEAVAIADVRLVAGDVVAGPAGQLSVGNTSLLDPLEVTAIGNAETLVGTLTRAGGIIAQLAATDPSAVITVTPVNSLTLPATSRSLAPSQGHPKL